MLNNVQKIWKLVNSPNISMEDLVQTVLGKIPLVDKISKKILDKLYTDQEFYLRIWSSITRDEYDRALFKRYLKGLVFPSTETKKTAVRIDYTNISIFEKEDDICLEALNVHIRALEHMEYHSPVVQRFVLSYMKRDSLNSYIDLLKVTEPEIAEEIININSAYLRMIPENLQTEELVWKVIEKRPELIGYVKNPSDKIKMYICEKCPSKIEEIEHTTAEMQMTVITKLPQLFKYIRNPADSTCMYILENIETFMKSSERDKEIFRDWVYKEIFNKAINEATNEETKVYGRMKYASLFK